MPKELDLYDVGGFLAGAIYHDPNLREHRSPRAAIIDAVDLWLKTNPRIRDGGITAFADSIKLG